MKIVIPVGCRSDQGLSAPIIKRLQESNWCDVQVVQLEPQNFIASYQKIEYYCKGEPHIGNHNHKKPDLIFITGDRVEMCAAACAAFHNKVKIAHYYGGVVNVPITTFDDIDRHCITLWSDLQFVECDDAYIRVKLLKHSMKLDMDNVFNVGISHLDDLEIDESLVPHSCFPECHKQEYDLVLINAEPLIEKSNFDAHLKYKRPIIQIGGNPDGTVKKLPPAQHYENLPRAQFLGLLKNCTRFITNSSSAIYEAPYFLKPEQIIMIGDRNRNRPKVECKPGASDRIVKILQERYNGT